MSGSLFEVGQSVVFIGEDSAIYLSGSVYERCVYFYTKRISSISSHMR